MRYPRVDQALRMAAEWHGGAERDGADPLPYLTHPVEVMTCLRYVGAVVDEDLLCAAVLHDVLEETKVSPDELQKLFGLRPRELVQELTRTEPSTKETAGLSKDQVWELRSNMLLGEIAQMSSAAQQIKLADRLSNLREAARTKTGRKLTRYFVQTRQILITVPRSVNSGLWDAIQGLLPKQK